MALDSVIISGFLFFFLLLLFFYFIYINKKFKRSSVGTWLVELKDRSRKAVANANT